MRARGKVVRTDRLVRGADGLWRVRPGRKTRRPRADAYSFGEALWNALTSPDRDYLLKLVAKALR